VSAGVVTVSNEELIRQTWAAIAGGDLGVLESVLAPQARWRAVEDGPWNCENRAAIIDVMGSNLSSGLAGAVEEVIELGERAIVAFRPSAPRGEQAWPLDQGIRYVVVTFRAGVVVELKGCADRAAALAYAECG
jgi:ketosteroid isomerase-like protein